MRSLYSRILLSYAGTVVLSLLAFIVISGTVGGSRNRENFRRVFQLELEAALASYQRGGTSALARELERQDQLFGSSHFLTDAKGIDLVSGEDRSALLSRQRSVIGNLARQFTNSEGVSHIRSADGQHQFVIVARPWVDMRQQLPVYVLLAVTVTLLYSVVVFGIVSPLKAIAATAERFGRGDLAARANIDRRDEIGDLARSFNAMADRTAELLVAERRLLQDVSHELRSPLARAAFAAELARTAPDREAAVDRLKKELGVLTGLVESLVDVTRAEGEQWASLNQVINVRELVAEVVESCTLEADARLCRILVRSTFEGTIRGDRELLRRAIDNVLRNAIHYAPPKSDIEISARADDRQVALSVRDYGPGVPDELLSRIFEPFFRVDVTRTPSTGGVGLGLAIVRRIIDLHHGTLKAENEAPGLRVTIAVPLSA